MTGIPHSVHVRELQHRELHIRELEAEVNRQANIISHMADDRARLRSALSDIADGYERHNPGWWIKRAKAALAYGRS